MGYTEAKELVGEGAAGGARKRKFNIRKHYRRHGQELGAKDVWQYLRQASALRRKASGKSAPVFGYTDGVRRFRKQGRYIDLTPDKKIISFGRIV